MNHEMRGALTAIMGFAETIKDELFGPVGTERYRDYAGAIHKSGTEILTVISDQFNPPGR